MNTLVYGSVSGTTTVDISGYVPLAANPDQLVTAVAAVMMHGQVSDNMRSTLVTHAFRNSRQYPAHQGGLLSDGELIAVPGRTLKGRIAMAFSRRDFLKRSCCTAAAGFAAASFNRFGLVNALAQSSQDYKALVCVFLFGGNDSNNMIVPLSSSGYASYQQARSVLALPQASLLPIAPPSAGARSDFHPRLAEMQSLFNQKHLAVLANVGTLVRPTTRDSIFGNDKVQLPRNLFSHEDQQAQMQTAALDANNGRRDGRGERRTRFNPSTARTSPSLFRWPGPIFFARACPPAPFSPAATPRGCSPASAIRRNLRAGWRRCRTC